VKEPEYSPAACDPVIVIVPPTLSVPLPVELNEPEAAGLLVNAASRIVSLPPCRVRITLVGRVIV